MKGIIAARLGLAMAGVLLAGSALAQGPGGELNAGPGPGFGERRPPMERAFGPRGDHGRWWNNPKMVERLKLTDEQRKAMDGILLEHREKLIDLRASLQKAELAMEPLIRDDQPNEANILAQIDKVAQARAELEKANARFLLAIRGKLTPEQWKQLQTDRANRGPERGWGHGGQGPGGPYHRQGPPLPPTPQGAEPQVAAPQGAGPQSMVDEGAGPDGLGAPGAGAEQ
ncbi:MAG: Spy/CpxP family protein refolding chaperone [Terracidiphilus sp.]|jgi:Spy/CpxP family protein refolding chaperone